MADVLISSELLVDDVQIDSSLNSSSIDIDADIGSTTIIQTEAVKAYATEEEDGVLLTVIDFYGTTTGLVHNGEKGDTGNTGATGAAAGFGSVTASVDSNVGTPSVEVSTSGADTAKNFSFAFHNLKGDKGDTGSTGAAAGFGTVSASVDSTTGTPSVEVSTSGTDTSKNFSFAFSGLKGETGATGQTGQTGATGAAAGFGTVTATVDANVGTPSVEVSTSGTDTAKNFAFAFHNLKGQKGETGDGVPSGGTDGQLLSKTSSGTAWIDPPSTDDHKWNDVTLNKANSTSASDIYVPTLGTSTSATTAYLVKGSNSPTANVLAKYDGDKYLKSTTPTSSDSSTKVATTAFVASALSGITFPVTSVNGQTGAVTLSIPSDTSDLVNDSGFITASDIPTEVYYVEMGGAVDWAEVVTAYNAGKLIVGKDEYGDFAPLANITVIHSSNPTSADKLWFFSLYEGGNSLVVNYNLAHWNGSSGWSYNTYYELATTDYVTTELSGYPTWNDMSNEIAAAIGTAIGNSY